LVHHSVVVDLVDAASSKTGLGEKNVFVDSLGVDAHKGKCASFRFQSEIVP